MRRINLIIFIAFLCMTLLCSCESETSSLQASTLSPVSKVISEAQTHSEGLLEGEYDNLFADEGLVVDLPDIDKAYELSFNKPDDTDKLNVVDSLNNFKQTVCKCFSLSELSEDQILFQPEDTEFSDVSTKKYNGLDTLAYSYTEHKDLIDKGEINVLSWVYIDFGSRQLLVSGYGGDGFQMTDMSNTLLYEYFGSPELVYEIYPYLNEEDTSSVIYKPDNDSESIELYSGSAKISELGLYASDLLRYLPSGQNIKTSYQPIYYSVNKDNSGVDKVHMHFVEAYDKIPLFTVYGNERIGIPQGCTIMGSTVRYVYIAEKDKLNYVFGPSENLSGNIKETETLTEILSLENALSILSKKLSSNINYKVEQIDLTYVIKSENTQTPLKSYARLCWQFRVYDPQTASQMIWFVDAQNGEIDYVTVLGS